MALLIILKVDASAKTNDLRKNICVENNPVLIADTLRKQEPKQFVHSSVSQLTENIYCSWLGRHLFIEQQLQEHYFTSNNLDFLETIGLNAFYDGDYTVALKNLVTVFDTTQDSLQKALTCLNIIKISFLNKNFNQASVYTEIAKDSLKKYYTYKQNYELVFTEAKIALARGLTDRAENLIISSALPMSNKLKGKYNELNCYLFLGKIYLKANKLTQAKWFFIQANSLAIQKNYINGQIETSLLLAKTKIKVGDKAVALQDLAKAKRLIDADHQIYSADFKNLIRLASR